MQTGQKQSFSANTIHPPSWVDNYADYLYTYAITHINDEELAKDLVQETFLAALERVDKFEGRSSERTWLTAILKFKVIDIYRKNAAVVIKQPDLKNAEQEDHDFFDVADGHWNDRHRPVELGMEGPDALENKEFQRILQLCINKLPLLWHSVFTMKHMDEASTQDICSTLKVSASNFWVIIHRAKVNLRACLQKNWI